MPLQDNNEMNQDENEVVSNEETNLDTAQNTSDSVVEEVKEAVEAENLTTDALEEVSTENTEVSSEESVPEEVPSEEPPVAETPVEEPSSEPETPVEAVENETPEEAKEEEIKEETGEEKATEGEEAVSEEESPRTVDEDTSDATMKAVEKIISESEDFGQLVAGSNTNELILILDFFTQQESVGGLIKRAGMVKKAYDALSAKEEIPNSLQSRFSSALSRFNKKRSLFYKEIEKEKDENSKSKRLLLDKLKEIVDTEDMNRYKEVRDIQNDWKRIGFIRKEDMEDFYREFRHLLDQFYKMREMHFQLRDYDRKINLTEKEKLIEELKGIIPTEEQQENREVWQEKNELLTSIQGRWKAIGHVPREDMDKINESYRDITEQFFSLRHEFYEGQDSARQENADAKVVLLEKMKEFSTFASAKPNEWNEATQKLREMQEEWKTIGRAPEEVNSALWKEYRGIGNVFFTAKADFFRNLDDVRNTNLATKRSLCEQAEALKENSEWEKTSNELKRLQTEWKEVGPVPDRYSNKVWKRFRAACDAFFESRRAHYEVLRGEELVNLEAKKALIEEVKKVSIEELGSADKAIARIKELQASWKDIGKVPYKDKDSIWKVFRTAIDEFFNTLRGNRSERNVKRVRESVESLPVDKRTRAVNDKVFKLRRRIEASQDKIESYSSNILYISRGKSGDSLRAQIQGEIDKEKRTLVDLKKQMRELNEMLKKPEKKEKPKAEEKATEAKEKPVTEESAAEKPAKEEPTAEKPAAEEPVAEKPAAEEPVAEKPAAEEPAAEEPAAEKPEEPKAE